MNFGNPNLISALMISNEAEDVSGRTSAEIERVVYVRVKDFKFLDNATGADRQEQWSIKIPKTEENAGSGSLRVRKIINLREPGAAVQYVMASKLDIGSMGASAETPEPSTADQFNIFKYLANKGMLKDRYYYPIEGTDLMWEVDCFPKPGELYHDWVKIDLEKWPRGKELPALPMEFIEMFDGSEGMTTPETDSKIKELYETMFLTANTKTPLATYDEPDVSTTEDGQQKTEGVNNGGDTSGQGNADGSDAGKDTSVDGASGGGGDDGSGDDANGDGSEGGDGSGNANPKEDGGDTPPEE